MRKREVKEKVDTERHQNSQIKTENKLIQANNR